MTITYNPSTNFGQKDSLPVNDPDKVIYGAEFTTEFNAIQTAFSTAAPTNSPTFTGTVTFSGDVALNGSVNIGSESVSDTDVQGWNATKATVDAGASNWDEAYGWGDHAQANYSPTYFTDISGTTNNNTIQRIGDALRVSALPGTLYSDINGDGSASFMNGITAENGGTSAQWNTAYGWGDHSQAGYSSSDTTYSGGTNITLSGTTFNLDSSLTGLSDVTTSSVSIGSWEIKLDGNDLRFVYNGTDRVRFTTNGTVIAENNVTAYGSA
jgi:hypothetical protein